MKCITVAASLILYLRKKTANNTSGSWIEWREILLPVFEHEGQAGTINASVNAGKVKARKLKGKEDMKNMMNGLSHDDRIKIMELLQLYRLIDQNRKNHIPGTFNEDAWSAITGELNSGKENEEDAKQKAKEWYVLKKENRFKTEIFVPASVLPVAIDFSLRTIALWLYGLGVITDPGLFLLMQLLFIPLTIIFIALYRDRKIVQQTQQLISRINISKIRINIKNTAWHYLLIFILALLGPVIGGVIKGDFMPMEIAIYFCIPVYTTYLLILQTRFSKAQPSYQDINLQIEERQHRELTAELTPEQNDEEIINLEVNLKAENERMDAYVIEAALFGALAFSGFLQIISVEDLSMNFINEFNHHILNVFKSIVNGEGQNIQNSINFILGREGLMVMLCCQALLCSVFFLSVIASRLRYSSLTDHVDRSLQLSKSYNEREEFIIRNQEDNPSELKRFNEKIKNLLKQGYQKQDEIQPIMEFMRFFRSLGISMFFIIIVSSGMAVSVWLSVILFGISVLSLVYFRFGKLREFIKHFSISVQEFYYQVDKYVHWICWSMVVVAVIFRTFGIIGGNQILGLGFLFLFLHYLMNLFVPVQFDFDMKGSENAFGAAGSFHNFLTYLFKIALAIFFLGFMFKAQHWAGAGPLVIVGASLLIGYFLLVKKVPQGPKWLGYLLGTSIALVFIGILFRIQHWPGTHVISYVSIPLVLISGVFTYLKRTVIRAQLKRAVFILCLLAVIFPFDYLWTSIWTLSFNYPAYKKVQTEKLIWGIFEDGNLTSSDPVQRDSLLSLSSQLEAILMKKTEPHKLNNWALSIYQISDDTLLLRKAAEWAKKAIELDSNWNYLNTYAALLYKLNQYEAAKMIAEEAFEKGGNWYTKLLLDRIKDSLATKTPLDSLQGADKTLIFK